MSLLLKKPDNANKNITIEGTLDRFVYQNKENGWSVARIEILNPRHIITAVGSLFGLGPGEKLKLNGSWVHDAKYGEQFQINSYTSVYPATINGLKRYLGSGSIHGIGPFLAERIIEKFQLETLEIIENDPKRLMEINGIGPTRTEMISEAWQSQKTIKDVMIFLQEYEISTTYATKIFQTYGDDAIQVVQSNPYQLADDIFGIGFKTADKIAQAMGTLPESPQRAQAGVIYVLGEMSSQGHVFAYQNDLIENANQLLEIEASIVLEALEQMQNKDKIVRENTSQGIAVFLKSLHHSESGIADQIRQLQQYPLAPLTINKDAAWSWLEKKQNITLAPLQIQAIEQALTSKLMVITGGPGTGKTTITRSILSIVLPKNKRVELCAPTGRAAKRLSEATNCSAKTIHRLLEFSPKNMRFMRNAESPLVCDILIVDEMSMVDTVLFYHLLKAVPLHCQLILIGDSDQLPSVGPGNVLHDLIQSPGIEVVRLEHIFRQAKTSLIISNAHRINHGQMAIFSNEKNEDFYFIEQSEPDSVLDTLKEVVTTRIPQTYQIDPIDDIQVLTPMHKGLLGAKNLNKELQSLLCKINNASPSWAPSTFRLGDKVMQIVNNYELDVYNGDIGRIQSFDETNHRFMVRFDSRIVPYEIANLNELVLAYACSIHKSQGSEFPVVVIPVHTQHYIMLQRNLIYTGLTRGKNLVVMIGTKRALAIAIKNAKTRQRNSLLKERLHRPN